MTATPCRHGPPLSHPIVGDVIGFALDWGEGVLWISGDTVLYDGVQSVADRVPIHYEGWKHFVDGRRGIERAIAAAPTDLMQRFRWLELGRPTEL